MPVLTVFPSPFSLPLKSLQIDTTEEQSKSPAESSCGLQALREKAAAVKAAKMKLFVRRGGPNYQAGLALMRQLGQELDIPIDVYAPDSSMTGICKLAIDYVRSFD